MGAIYALCAITGLLSIIIVYLENKGFLAQKYVLKTVASLCFVFVAILSLIYGEGFYNWKALVLCALVLGMLGDIFLSSENVVPEGKPLNVLNIAGGGFFAVGHIVYVVWLLRFTEGFNYWLLFILAAFPILLLLLSKLKVMKPGKILIPAMLYSAFLGLMLVAAINAYLELSAYAIGKYILAGGILFCVSDFILAYYNFGNKEKTYVKYIYMPAYYAAQLLFAMTILF